MKAVIIRYAAPDGEISPEERLGADGAWHRLGKAFYNFGTNAWQEDGPEGLVLVLECEESYEGCARSLVEDARAGKYGPEAQTYFAALRELP